MSDVETATMRVDAPARCIVREHNKLYYVAEAQLDGTYETTGRGYPHSTSAYAQLGRIVSRDTMAAIKSLRG